MGPNENSAQLYCLTPKGLVPINGVQDISLTDMGDGGLAVGFGDLRGEGGLVLGLPVSAMSELDGTLLRLRRLLRMEPWPRKLSRRRFVKLLMSYGAPRDLCVDTAANGLAACGSYAAAWRDLIESLDQQEILGIK